jgi:hypothetical protein
MEDKNDKKAEQKQKRLKKRFVRWRTLSMDQLGKVINLLLGLSVATIGYQINFLVDGKYDSPEQKIDLIVWLIRFAFVTSLILLFVSVLLGIICNYIRLLDFRYTALLIKKRMDNESSEAIWNFKETVNKYGERTWTIFAWQTATFWISFLLLAVFYFWRYIG